MTPTGRSSRPAATSLWPTLIPITGSGWRKCDGERAREVAEVYRVRFRSRSARRELDGLGDENYLRIAAAIYQLRENPRPAGLKKLTGHQAYRIRVGDYRVVYTVDDKAKEVRIQTVRKRDERTYD